MELYTKAVQFKGFKVVAVEAIENTKVGRVPVGYRLLGDKKADKAKVSVIWHHENRPKAGQFYCIDSNGKFWMEPEGFDQQLNVMVDEEVTSNKRFKLSTMLLESIGDCAELSSFAKGDSVEVLATELKFYKGESLGLSEELISNYSVVILPTGKTSLMLTSNLSNVVTPTVEQLKERVSEYG